jgi:hypothetical protein
MARKRRKRKRFALAQDSAQSVSGAFCVAVSSGSNPQPDRYERRGLPSPCRISSDLPAVQRIMFDLRSRLPMRHLCELEKKMHNEFHVDDWVVFDLRIGQIKKLDDWQEFSDGTCSTSGQIVDRFRPLTLRNKVITETFDYWYSELSKIDGERGFNYPRISQYFWALALEAIDSEDASVESQKARDFVDAARRYDPEIHGVRLFRPNIGV